MSNGKLSILLLAGAALALTACGGGSGGGSRPETLPPPPSPPPPPPGIIGNATTSQQFVSKGTSYDHVYGIVPLGTASQGDASQLSVRYDASQRVYEVQLPGESSWQALSNTPRPYSLRGEQFLHVIAGEPNGYDYSALATWSSTPSDKSGNVALGIPTPTSGVPIAGSANYSGVIAGWSNETSPDALFGGELPGNIEGTINLSFNFGTSTLSGKIDPTLYTFQRYALPSLTFTNTVYSSGSTTFSGKFNTGLSGQNSFSGRFTGPAAQELIGNFAFPYQSPFDSKPYQAAGSFVGKQP